MGSKLLKPLLLDVLDRCDHATKFGTAFDRLSFEIRFRENASLSWLDRESIMSTIGCQINPASAGLMFLVKCRSKRFGMGFDSIVSMHWDTT
jgi:hypothetical protein